LNDILKGEWKYKGVVVSDWGAVNNTEQAIHNGLDLEFGSWTNGLSAGTKMLTTIIWQTLFRFN
jgi:beta-glucosidase